MNNLTRFSYTLLVDDDWLGSVLVILQELLVEGLVNICWELCAVLPRDEDTSLLVEDVD